MKVSDPWASAATNKPAGGAWSAYTGNAEDASSANSYGKAEGKGRKKVEDKSRTLYFGKFPESKEDAIKGHIEERTKESREHIGEIYAFGKFSQRGAARFKTEETMWDHLKNNKGMLQYEVMGTTLYANADSMFDPSPNKSKAMRKMV